MTLEDEPSGKVMSTDVRKQIESIFAGTGGLSLGKEIQLSLLDLAPWTGFRLFVIHNFG